MHSPPFEVSHIFDDNELITGRQLEEYGFGEAV